MSYIHKQNEPSFVNDYFDRSLFETKMKMRKLPPLHLVWNIFKDLLFNRFLSQPPSPPKVPKAPPGTPPPLPALETPILPPPSPSDTINGESPLPTASEAVVKEITPVPLSSPNSNQEKAEQIKTEEGDIDPAQILPFLFSEEKIRIVFDEVFTILVNEYKGNIPIIRALRIAWSYLEIEIQLLFLKNKKDEENRIKIKRTEFVQLIDISFNRTSATIYTQNFSLLHRDLCRLEPTIFDLLLSKLGLT